jgi:hypothetical protein
MEIFVITAGFYLIIAGFVASKAGKYKRNPFVAFLIGVFTTPIGGWMYLESGKKKGTKRAKNKGPWNEWMVKADRMVEEESWDNGRQAYLKALDLLQAAQNSKGKYSSKYLQSKISEIHYSLDLIDAKRSQGTKVVQLPKSHSDSEVRKASND